MKSASFLRPPALGLVAVLVLSLPRVGRGEDSISYKYEDYRESGGRIGVKTQGAYIEKDFGTQMRFKIEGVLDAIAGATPTGQPARSGSDQVPLAQLHERRKAWNASLARQFERINVAVGLANSRESDYVSTGWSINTLTDFNQKNTTLLVGLAGTEDDIKVFYQSARAGKRTNDLIVGVTQLLDAQTSVLFNFTWGRQRGYLADPYKLVQKRTEFIPGVFIPLTFAENRLGEREKWIGLWSLNRSFARVQGALEATYRFYHDTYGINAHTIDVSWFQRIGSRVVLRPAFRFYDQEAANFYHYNLDDSSVVPFDGPPRPNGPFYSSDYRLSAMQTFNYGLKIIGRLTEQLQLDAALEQYDMRGRDGITPQSAYARARIITAGLKFSW